MTVLNRSSSRTFKGNGVTVNFATGFRFLDNAHLTVYLEDVLQIEGTHYTVAGAGDPEPGGTVTMLTAPANDTNLYVERNTPILQEVDLRPEGRFLADDIEEMFDKLTLIAQETRREADAANAQSPVVVDGGAITMTNVTFATGDEVEDVFPLTVAVTGGSTMGGFWAVRLRNLDDPTEVFDEPPSIQAAPGVGDNVSILRCSGLKPNTNYALKFAAVP